VSQSVNVTLSTAAFRSELTNMIEMSNFGRSGTLQAHARQIDRFDAGAIVMVHLAMNGG
jgi:hypothetical protein